MKKIIYLILAILFLFPVVAKADAGAPEIKGYKVVSKSGQDEPYYDWDLTVVGTVPAGTEVEINLEEKINGELYGLSYNSLNGYLVKLSDFKVSKGQELDENEAKYVAKVLSKDGLTVYSGPSYINEEVGTLSYGDDIKAGEPDGGTWIYIEKGNIKGYVDAGFTGQGVGILTKGDKIDEETNKIYKEYYKSIYGYRNSIIVYENGEYKIVNYVGIPYEGNEAKTVKDCKLYENGKIDWSESQGDYGTEIGVVPSGTTLKPIYEGGEYYFSYYVEYNGKKGWIKYEDYNDACVDFYATSSDPTENPSEITKEEYVTDVIVDKIDKDDNKKFKFTTKEIIIGSIILGVVIVLTAIITMILVNKKKKA